MDTLYEVTEAECEAVAGGAGGQTADFSVQPLSMPQRVRASSSSNLGGEWCRLWSI